MSYCPDDTAAVFADFGVPVQVDGGVATVGRLDGALQVERDLGVSVPHGTDVLKVAEGRLGTLCPDQKITVNGVAYRYRGAVEGVRDRFDRVALVEIPQ